MYAIESLPDSQHQIHSLLWPTCAQRRSRAPTRFPKPTCTLLSRRGRAAVTAGSWRGRTAKRMQPSGGTNCSCTGPSSPPASLLPAAAAGEAVPSWVRVAEPRRLLGCTMKAGASSLPAVRQKGCALRNSPAQSRTPRRHGCALAGVCHTAGWHATPAPQAPCLSPACLPGCRSPHLDCWQAFF